MSDKDRLKKEMRALTFVLKTKMRNNGRAILKDVELARSCYEISDRRRKNILLGLLLGRSADTFTSIFLMLKNQPSGGNFKTRINRIVNNNLTSNRFVINDLHVVRRLRNDLFHEANKYYSMTELYNYVFHAAHCMNKLCLDI